jgi:hypothetical protein
VFVVVAGLIVDRRRKASKHGSVVMSR